MEASQPSQPVAAATPKNGVGDLIYPEDAVHLGEYSVEQLNGWRQRKRDRRAKSRRSRSAHSARSSDDENEGSQHVATATNAGATEDSAAKSCVPDCVAAATDGREPDVGQVGFSNLPSTAIKDPLGLPASDPYDQPVASAPHSEDSEASGSDDAACAADPNPVSSSSAAASSPGKKV